MNPQKESVDKRGVLGEGSQRVGLGSSGVVVGQNCLWVGQDSSAAGHGFPVVGQDLPMVEQGSVVVSQEFPVMRLDSPVMEKGSVVVEQELPVSRLDNSVVEEGSVFVRQELPVVGQDSFSARQGYLKIRKRSLSPPTNQGSLFGHVSEPVTAVGYMGKSSRLDQTSRVVRGPTRSGHSFRSLSVILVFLLTAIDVTSAGHCPSNSEDLASRTVLAKVILVGQFSRQEPTVEGLWTAEFKVEEPLKGTDLPSNRKIFVSGLSSEEGERECAGGNFTAKRKYFVFLNGSAEVQSEGRDGPRRIYWTSGPPVEFSKAAKKTIEKYSCPTCAEAPRVKPLLPPIDRSGSLILRCRVSGQPPPTITWYKGTEVVSIDGRRIKTSRHGTHLTIRRVKPSDAGLYSCQASNVLGSVNSTSVSVTVKASSSIENTSTPEAPNVVRCDQQVFCLNQGTCFTNPILGPFCICPQEFTGQRCQDRSVGETKPRPEKPLRLNLHNLLIVGLILIGLILLVLTVIAYCLAMTRYDNARRMNNWTAEDAEETDVRANGALLRSLNGLQSEKLQKFSASNGTGDSSVDDKRVGLPQVLVTLIDEEDRTRTTITSGKGEFPAGNANRPEMRVYCPPDQSATCPNLSRPRLAAVSTTPSSAASSINLHLDNAGPATAEEQMNGNC